MGYTSTTIHYISILDATYLKAAVLYILAITLYTSHENCDDLEPISARDGLRQELYGLKSRELRQQIGLDHERGLEK